MSDSKPNQDSTSFRKAIWIAVYVLLVSGAAFFAWITWRGRVARHLTQAFNRAEEIGQLPLLNKAYPSMRSEEWDRTLTFSNNLSVRIYGHEGPSGVGAIYLKYSDEATPRMIAGSWDYVGPYAIRFDQQLRVLFIKQSGLSAGVFKETILCEYDLQRRTMLHQVHISNPSLLH